MSFLQEYVSNEIPQLPMSDFATYLITHKYLEEHKIRAAIAASSRQKISLILYLGQNFILSFKTLAEITANYFGLPLFDLQHYDLNCLPSGTLTPEQIKKYSALPLYQNANHLLLAIADPSLPNLGELNFLTGMTITLVIVEADKLAKIIHSIHAALIEADIDVQNFEEDEVQFPISAADEEDALERSQIKTPLVKFLNKILVDAVNQRASDIHFEPYATFFRIRYRLDGILYELNRQPIKVSKYIISRLKVLGDLDISERRVPQDGRFKISLPEKDEIDFRLSTCPTLYGEKAVVRILKSSNDLLNINILGMNEEQKKLFINAITYSQGMILVTGPTGSGKTITLYTALNHLNTEQVNIASVEDPIEIHLTGVNQVQVNSKIGLTFAKTMRAFLRQDPDIIMIGEIRDLETAEVAVRAAQTGHLVLSTLHTNSAPETLVRLANMGVAAYNIASTVILIIAQRLVRRLCDYCKTTSTLSQQILKDAGFAKEEIINLKIFQPGSCARCNNGYKGRIGIYEVMPISKAMGRLIMENAGPITLAQQARSENIPNLRRCALDKVKEGITSLEEINRVIKE